MAARDRDEALMASLDQEAPLVVVRPEELSDEAWRPLTVACPSARAVLWLDGAPAPESLPAPVLAVVPSAKGAAGALKGAMAARAALVAAARRLAAADHELSRFVYIVSHDLKGPIQGMVGLAGLVAARHAAELGVDGARACARIEDSGLELARMLDGLTVYSRLGRGGLRLERVALTELVDEVMAAVTARLPEHLPYATLAPDLPTLDADRGVLEAAILELLDNAIRYQTSRPARVEVTWQPAPHERGGTLRLRDHGPGLPDAEHERVFDLFYRVHGTPGEGIGCGLTLARRGATLHGGHLSLEAAADGTGTVARLFLPAAGR